MTCFQEIGWNVHFWAKKGIFGPKLAQNGGKRDVSSKIQKCHFRRIRKPKLCAKFQKIPMHGFWDLWVTDGRTQRSQFIGSIRYRGEPKNNKLQWVVEKIKSKVKFWFWTKKGPKWEGLDFSRTTNLYFLKEEHKISFYTKNQQNSMNHFEDLSQNCWFWT